MPAALVAAGPKDVNGLVAETFCRSPIDQVHETAVRVVARGAIDIISDAH